TFATRVREPLRDRLRRPKGPAVIAQPRDRGFRSGGCPFAVPHPMRSLRTVPPWGDFSAGLARHGSATPQEGLGPMRSRNIRRRPALAAVGLLATAGLSVITAAPAHAAVQCRIDYTKAWGDNSQFGANVVINNLGDALNGWTLTFNLPAGRISTGWPV